MDPVYSKIATEEEHQRALIVGKAAKKGLEDRGWYGIVMASSGNGVHLLVPIDLPNLLPVGTVDEVPKKLVRDVQRIISTQYSNLPEVRLSVSPTQTGLSELTERRTRKDLRPGN
jgi:hypothetical protein